MGVWKVFSCEHIGLFLFISLGKSPCCLWGCLAVCRALGSPWGARHSTGVAPGVTQGKLGAGHVPAV